MAVARGWLTCLALFGLVSAFAGDEEFAAVVPSRPINFPQDFGAHPEFRTEWWYVTGWITDPAGTERGFQVTFFRVGTGLAGDNPSRFAPQQLVLAHGAIADPARGRLLHAERSARADGRLAGADSGATRAWIREWRLAGDGSHYVAHVEDDEFSLDLTLEATQPPMLNGFGGYSRKGPDPAGASYYYSQPQLTVAGQVRLGDRKFPVRGRAWLDHEWSSAYLPPGARGWDWIGINFDGGGALMAFRMRDSAGRAVWAGATLREADGRQRIFGPAEIRFRPGRPWTSPRTGSTYPVTWTVEVGHGPDLRRFDLQPMMDDQELDSRTSTGTIYWEGAVRCLEQGSERGKGYLELTGYDSDLAL
ncbi:MAG: carotenoid 1,2-hydratase [Zoogloeaceae bacterium]|nr:carotenoid 1,2-hydratase [Zoogloeaceae bacterium]